MTIDRTFFLIRTSFGYVHSFNAQHCVVSRCDAESEAKRFATRASAQRWLSNHVDIGYGLNSDDASIVRVSL